MTKREMLNPELTEDSEGQLQLPDDAKFVYSRINHVCNYPMGVDPVWGIA